MGCWGGKKTAVVLDEVDVGDAGDVVETLIRGFVERGSSIVTKPPKPVSSVSALARWDGIEGSGYSRRSRGS
jgi:hypothetical protein